MRVKMNKIDFSKYIFRCSSLPTLMVNGRSKTELLSETSKAALREIWIREMFGREKFDTTNKFTEKGIMCEPDSMDLVQKVTSQVYFKNNQRFTNEYIGGTPDIAINPNTDKAVIKDIKTSWNIFTFANVDQDSAMKSYYYQLLGYMWLTGAKKSQLIYTLVNTPPEIMADELYKLSFKYPEINESEEKAERFKKNYIFDDIPAELRMKVFDIEYNQEDIILLTDRLIAARDYLATLSL